MATPSRRYPHRWFVHVDLRVIDQEPDGDGHHRHFNGHSYKTWHFRTRAQARGEFERLVENARTSVPATVIEIWRRYPHTRDPESLTFTWGTTGARGSDYGTEVVEAQGYA